MEAPAMKRSQAALDLALWQADAESMSSSDLYIWLRESGLPPEVAIRLKELVNFTATVGTKVIRLGKVILIKLIEFIKQHPNLAVGMALGAAVSFIVGSIPFLGPLLTPIVLPLGLIVGAVAGHRLDQAQDQGTGRDSGFISITQDVLEIAREFFILFVETVQAIADEIVI